MKCFRCAYYKKDDLNFNYKSNVVIREIQRTITYLEVIQTFLSLYKPEVI